MTAHDRHDKHPSSGSSTTSISCTAMTAIFPALASTMCCWGPPLLGAMGATVGVKVNSLQRVTRYRPVLLGISATMISYSFFQVYARQGPPAACCQEHHRDSEKVVRVPTNTNLQFQRAVVWGSLVIAIAGASYGRRLPTAALTQAPIMMRTQPLHSVELRVDGMSCTGCANKVRQAMAGVEGVLQVQAIDPATGKTILQVQSDDVNLSLLQEAVQRAGSFTVTKVP